MDRTRSLPYARQGLYLQWYSSLFFIFIIYQVHIYKNVSPNLWVTPHALFWKVKGCSALTPCDVLVFFLRITTHVVSSLLLCKDNWTNPVLYMTSTSSLKKLFTNYAGWSLHMRKPNLVERTQPCLTFMSGRLEQSHSMLRVVEQWFQISKATRVFNERKRHWNVTNSKFPSFKKF